MQTINKLRDLEPFGIFALTGEADALCFRMLCDVSADGADLVCETYGLDPSGCGLSAPWNSSTNNREHVASIMLPYGAWREVGVIALVRSGCWLVLETPHGLFGLEGADEYKPAPYDPDTCQYTGPARAKIDGHRGGDWFDWPSCYGDVVRQYQAGSNPHVGTRNVHTMSGRTV